jgi:hypothetical protein
MKLAFAFVCYHVWMRIPVRASRFNNWLLSWAGYYAIRPDDTRRQAGSVT